MTSASMPVLSALTSLLFTDLYELKMAQAYAQLSMHEQAVFELFFREMPEQRNFVVAAGLADLLDYIEQLQITAEELDYLRAQGSFTEEFLEQLRRFRFTGDVDAVAEGTPIFGNEPLVQITAPLMEAQLIETLVLNQIHFQTVAASKAARVVLAARGRTVVDFGARRAHGSDAALKVARTSYLMGAAGTSLVLAGQRYGIPIFGTMAHSYVQAHDREAQALEDFASLYPDTTLLVDTYDTLAGVQKVIDLAARWGQRFQVRALRLDSGDLATLSREARRMLDAAGLTAVKLFVSGSLDEYKIAALLDAGAPIDGFGVGTRLAVIEDMPTLDMAYKLVEYAGQPRVKLSSHKVLFPGRKQVFRTFAAGRMQRDILGHADEQLPGERLLKPVVRGGRRVGPPRPALHQLRDQAAQALQTLPEALRSLTPAPPGSYPVDVSPALQRSLQQLRQQHTLG